MGDIGDYWREHREWKKRQKLINPERFAAKPSSLTKVWSDLGFVAKSDWHWQARIAGELVDFWPSKGKWMIGSKVRTGSHNALLTIVRSMKRKELGA